jgi:sulfite reductase beta subunit-like hemoprotein
MPGEVPEGFGGFRSDPPALGTGEGLPIVGAQGPDPEFDAWLETNVDEQLQPGYSIVTIRVPQGNLTGGQMHAIADMARQTADGMVRFTMTQNILLAWVPVSQLKRLYAALRMIGLADSGAREIRDIVTCPGAYSCNLALTKSMNLGEALGEMLRDENDAQVRKLGIRISGCPNSCGQHWIGDIGFYGNARKIEGTEVPYYQMLLGGSADESGINRFGFAIQSLPARLVPEATRRVLTHFKEHRTSGESFREYVTRHKVEFFRSMLADLAKPASLNAEIVKDWGDDTGFSLQLGRGECAS